jgi:hypothetical protein
MDEIITAYVGLDSHAESTAIAVAEAGSAAPRSIGTVGAKFTEQRVAYFSCQNWRPERCSAQ